MAATARAAHTGTGVQPATEPSVAAELAALLAPLVGGELPIRLTAWDGSSAGPSDAPGITLTSPRALRRLLWHPGELGAAQAFVTGELEVDGDLVDGFVYLRTVAEQRGLTLRRPPARTLVQAARLAKRWGVLGPPAPAPASQIRVRGRLHSKRRDRAVIAHHYDTPAEFYRLILDDHMAYSCAYVTGAPLSGEASAGYSLEDAQRDKLDLVCRKLGLDQRPGMRLLDIGCGWGSLSLHAAKHYGAQVTGLTISAEQRRFALDRARGLGVSDQVELRLQDYREVTDTGFDAVVSLEMGEHVGERNYAAFTELLARAIAPEGRVLIQQMSRAGGHYPGGGPFIEGFITPDMTMRPVGETVALLEQAGLEVRDVHALREHYAWTARAWRRRFLARRDELVAIGGEELVRVWDAYLAGGLLAFQQGRMGVDQILAVPRRSGEAALPGPRPADWSAPR